MAGVEGKRKEKREKTSSSSVDIVGVVVVVVVVVVVGSHSHFLTKGENIRLNKWGISEGSFQ